MTRLAGPKDSEAGKASNEVREMERKYFKNKGPWVSADKGRLGTDKLIAALSDSLGKMIDERHLPLRII
jgi:hypothetical protein